jgi:hypothetical protein
MDTSFPEASGRSQADAVASVATATKPTSTTRAPSAAGLSAPPVKVDGMWNPAGGQQTRHV